MPGVGVVLCRCNSLISSIIDYQQLSEEIQKNKKVSGLIEVDMACSPKGLKAVKEFISSENIERLIVAACSPLGRGALFKNCAGNLGIPRQVIEIVNLREQCAWLHEKESTLKKAVIMLKMGLNRVIKAKDVGNWQLDCVYINELKCDKCKRCIEECPNKAISLKEDGYPQVDSSLCVQCGVCAGGCPLGVMSLPDFRVEEIGAMLQPVSQAASPAVVGFFCDYAYEKIDLLGQAGVKCPPNLYIIRVPCTGAVNMMMVNDAIAEGIDGILLGGCHTSQCKLKKGRDLAYVRLENCRQSLEEEFLEKERVSYLSFEEDEWDYSRIDYDRCNGCGTCQKVCPFEVIEMTVEGKPLVKVEACRECGVCVSTCVAGAIELTDYRDEKILAEIDQTMVS